MLNDYKSHLEMITALKNSFPTSFYSQIEKRGAQVINRLRETQNVLIHAVLCNLSVMS